MNVSREAQNILSLHQGGSSVLSAAALLRRTGYKGLQVIPSLLLELHTLILLSVTHVSGPQPEHSGLLSADLRV